MNWKEKRFLVFGTGISGIAATELLKKEEIDVVIYDGNETVDVKVVREKSPFLADVPVILGELPTEELEKIDIAVLSPGVPTDLPIVNKMRDMGIAIWGEIELAYVFGKGKILAITGTNGKTTTTTLLGEIMKAAFDDVKVVGNIGIPYTSVASDTTEDTVIVAEISSFQLETIHSFCPQVSGILNITPDHLNRHHTMDNYIDAKKAITKNQREEQICVLNYEDEVLRAFGEKQPFGVVYFSSQRVLEKGLYLVGDEIRVNDGTEERLICKTGDLQILGKHNYENVMAATAMALGAGVSLKVIREVLLRFQAVEHRIEYVTEKRGVRFYNDSKGTNPDAAIQAIRAMEWPTLLIGGGYDKGSEYQEWIEAFEGKVKKFVLLGATREKIAQTAEACGYPKEDIIMADSLEEAIKICYTNAEKGDAVLLSPACASWGMFKNYEERGDLFKEMVKELEE